MILNSNLSINDLQDCVRILSNQKIYFLTKLSNPAKFPIIRAALFYYATECDGMFANENVMYEDFMYDINLQQTLTRTVIGPADKAGYLDTFRDLKSELPERCDLLYCTQVFKDHEHSEYLGSWLTITYREGLDQQLVWVFIDPDWAIQIEHSIADVRLHFPASYYYIAYGALDSWPRIMVGEYNAA